MFKMDKRIVGIFCYGCRSCATLEISAKVTNTVQCPRCKSCMYIFCQACSYYIPVHKFWDISMHNRGKRNDPISLTCGSGHEISFSSIVPDPDTLKYMCPIVGCDKALMCKCIDQCEHNINEFRPYIYLDCQE